MEHKEFTQLMNAARVFAGLPVMTSQEEAEDYAEFVREELAAEKYR